MKDGRFMQPFCHDTCFLLCGNQSFVFSDNNYLVGMLRKKNQILGDEFAKNLDCYKSHHSKQVAREKDLLEANKGKLATKTPIGTAFLTKCVYLTLKKAFIAK